MSKIIIGIHGLSNKPQAAVLRQYWHKALVEGLINIGHHDDVQFESVYWANYLYKTPQHDDDNFAFDSLFNEEPYVPAEAGALREYVDSWRDSVRSAALGIVGESVDAMKEHLGMDRLADWVLEKWLKDLSFYYDENRKLIDTDGNSGSARVVLQNVLRNVLRAHKDKEIMLIAHSMGSIIAYDVLRDIGRSDAPEDSGLMVSHFVTIGSPLGLPHVKGKIIEERKYSGVKDAERVRTPTIVTERWLNFSDPKDPVAADVHLRNDFRENRYGVRVEDDLVENDYLAPQRSSDQERKRNHHKSYGYLRTPELSRCVRRFLE